MGPRKRKNRQGSTAGAGGSGGEIRVIADRLHSASIHLLRRVRAADRESGLTPQRLSALSVVVFGGPVTLGGLAEAEQVSAPTITRLVQGLEHQGLIRRRRDPDDGRAYLLEATAAGRKLLDEGRRRRIDALVESISSLRRKDLKLLGRAAELMESLGSRPAARRRRGGSPVREGGTRSA